jgi:hypothetical protein
MFIKMPITPYPKTNQQYQKSPPLKMPKKQNWELKELFDSILEREKEARKK